MQVFVEILVLVLSARGAHDRLLMTQINAASALPMSFYD